MKHITVDSHHIRTWKLSKFTFNLKWMCIITYVLFKMSNFSSTMWEPPRLVFLHHVNCEIDKFPWYRPRHSELVGAMIHTFSENISNSRVFTLSFCSFHHRMKPHYIFTMFHLVRFINHMPVHFINIKRFYFAHQNQQPAISIRASQAPNFVLASLLMA